MSFDISSIPLKGITFESSSQVFHWEGSMFSAKKTVHLQLSQDSCNKHLINFKIGTTWLFFRWCNVQLHFDNNWFVRIHVFVVVKCSTNHAHDGTSHWILFNSWLAILALWMADQMTLSSCFWRYNIFTSASATLFSSWMAWHFHWAASFSTPAQWSTVL